MSEITPARLQAIREWLAHAKPCAEYADEMEDDPVTRYVCGRCDCTEDMHTIRDLLSAYEAAQREIETLKAGAHP